jgi:hypothetical protein
LRVGAIDDVIADSGVLFHRSEQQIDLLAVVHAADDDETIAVIGIELRCGHDRRHGSPPDRAGWFPLYTHFKELSRRVCSGN